MQRYLAKERLDEVSERLGKGTYEEQYGSPLAVIRSTPGQANEDSSGRREG